MKHHVLIVDGYNMIGAWPELQVLKRQNLLEDAREMLLRMLSEYANFTQKEVIVVFDAQFVPGMKQVYNQYQLTVVFTDKDQTADDYIEAYAYTRLDIKTQVTVATSDLAEQWQVFSAGALRQSARELYQQVERTKKQVRQEALLHHTSDYQRRSPWQPQQLQLLEEMLNKLQK